MGKNSNDRDWFALILTGLSYDVGVTVKQRPATHPN